MLEFEEDCFSYPSREEIEALEPDSRKSFLCLFYGVKCGVYKISNDLNNKIYIGSSKNIKSRFNEHIRSLSRGKHSSKHFQNFFDKHKNIHFTINVIEECDLKDIVDREQFYLDTLNPFGEGGFNICKTAYAPQCSHISERENSSRNRTIGFLQYDLDGKFIKEWDSAMNLASYLGVPRESLNKAANGRLQTLKEYIWKYKKGEIQQQLSKDFMDTIVLKPQKKIFAYSSEGELIAEFKSALDFQKRTGFDRKHIKKVCKRNDNRYKNLFWVLEK